jgi:hypothetical protein
MITNLLRLAGALSDPWPGLLPCLVQSKETGLSTTLDELIGLCDELGVEDPARELAVRRDRTGGGVPRDLGDACRRVHKVRLDHGTLVYGRCTLEPVSEQEFGIVLADSCMSDWVLDMISNPEI